MRAPNSFDFISIQNKRRNTRFISHWSHHYVVGYFVLTSTKQLPPIDWNYWCRKNVGTLFNIESDGGIITSFL
jgi:hypothetical protein